MSGTLDAHSTEPVRNFGLTNLTTREPVDHRDDLGLGRVELVPVQSQKHVRGEERGALAAVHEAVGLRERGRVRGRERGDVGRGIAIMQLARRGQRGFDDRAVAVQDRAALNGQQHRAREPARARPSAHGLAVQLTERVPVLAGAALVHCHGVVEVGIEGSYEQPFLGLDDMDLVAGSEVEAVEDGLGEDGDDGAAELFESDSLLQENLPAEYIL